MKVSIITACYNSATTIPDTIKSVLNQTYSNIEYVIIDGASKDNTLEVIKDILKGTSFESLAKIVSEPDKGIYDALNKGIENATGDIIGFLHADDIFYDKYVVENIVRSFNENNCEAVYGNLQYVSKDNTSRVIRNWVSKPFNKHLLKRGWMPAHPTLYLKKEVYEKFGNFNLSYKIAADYDFMLRILSQGVSTYFLRKVLIKMRVGGESNTASNLISKSKEDYKALRTNKVGGFYSLFLKNISKLPQFLS